METKGDKNTNIAVVAALVAVAAAIVFVLYYFIDPSWRWMPRCVFKSLTGYDCPGCGMQRALHSAVHGNFAAAWHYNPFAFFAIPAACLFIIVESGRFRWPSLHKKITHPMVIALILIAIIAFWIGRNIAGEV